MDNTDPFEAVYVDHTTLVGREAPDFTAKAVVGDEIVDYTLSENTWKQGKYTVLFFYPKDFTFVCPTELIAFSDAIQEFEKRNTQIVAVSFDSEFVHKAWKNTARTDGGVGDIAYPMVADVTHEIMQDYGVQSEGGPAFRGLFLIDANGVVRHMVVNDMPLGRSVKETLRMIDALQFTEKHGEVCPADWHPGDAAIDPSHAKEYFSKQGTVTVNN